MSDNTKKKIGRPRKVQAVTSEAPQAPVEAPVVAPAPAPAPKPAAPAGPPRVDVATFWRMQHAAASMRAAKAEAETARVKKLYILALLDTKNRVLDTEKEIDKAKKLAESHENTYLTFKRDLESRLGQPLANVAIDPDTGLVSHIPTK